MFKFFFEAGITVAYFALSMLMFYLGWAWVNIGFGLHPLLAVPLALILLSISIAWTLFCRRYMPRDFDEGAA